MAIAHRASAASGTTNPTTNFTITIPAGVQTDDLLYVAVTSRDAAGAIPNVVDDDADGEPWERIATSTNVVGTLWYKRATSDTASKTVTVTNCVGSASGGITAFSGGSKGLTPHDHISVETNASGNETHAGFVPSYANSMICMAVFNYGNDEAIANEACTDPGALTERFEQLSTGGSDCACALACNVQANGPNATGNIVWTQTDNTTYSVVWAVRPHLTPTISDAGDEGLYNGQTGVVINGTNFYASQGIGKIELGNSNTYANAYLVTQAVTNWTNTAITINVTQGILPSGPLYLYVTNIDNTTTAAYAVTVAGRPVITDAGDEAFYNTQTGVVITGTDFGSPQGSGTVSLNSAIDGTGTNVAQTVTNWTDTAITITIAQGALSNGTNYLIVNNVSLISSTGYAVTLGTRPTITDAGNELYYHGQTGIVISGTNFGASQGTVSLNSLSTGLGTNVTQTITNWSTNSITITTKQGALTGGTNYLIVQSTTLLETAGYAVAIYPRPRIANAGDELFYNGETNIIVTGSGFGSSQGSGSLAINSNSGGGGTNVVQSITSWNNRSITFTATQGALTAGTNYLIVTTGAGLVSASLSCAIYPKPAITNAEDELVYDGETGFDITGTGFGGSQGGGSVTLNTTADGSGDSQTQTVTGWSATSITITVDLGSLPPGTLYVIVTANSTFSSIGYPVTVGSLPVISNMGDESFSDHETGIIIQGTGFQATQGSGFVEFNTAANHSGYGLAQTVTAWSDTAITINLNLGNLTPGTLYVFVTNSVNLISASGYSVSVSAFTPPGVIQDWYIDYVPNSPLTLSHNDGDLNYDNGLGTPVTADGYIRGATTGAVAKVLDISGTAASGILTLTNTTARFQNNESLVWLNTVNFDGVINGGLAVGNVVTGASSGRTGTIRAIEYSGTSGTLYSEGFTGGAWTNNENIQVGGQTRALADGTGTINSTSWTAVLANGVLTPPTTTGILNYEGGSQLIPPAALVTGSVSGASGIVHVQLGVLSTGSLRLNDVSGTWQDSDTIIINKIVNYDNVVTGQRFRVGDYVIGSASAAYGRVLTVIDDGDDTGRIVLADQTGTFDHTTPDDLEVEGVKIAEVENNTFTLNAANVNGTLITEQAPTQGGLYSNSLNPVRSVNSLYTALMDLFAEADQLDDMIPITAQVKDQQYTLVNSWTIPDLSMRFIDQGSLQDESQDNIWTNLSSLGTVEGISDTVFAAISPQPQFYLTQAGALVTPFWLTGHINILVKVKTTTLANINNPDGQTLNGGLLTIFNRNYTDTYDHYRSTAIGGVAYIPLSTSNDANNSSGTHTMNYDGETAGPFNVGEIISTAGDTVIAIIASLTDLGTTGTIQYTLMTTANFADDNAFTGAYSGAGANVNGSPTSLVAGYTDVTFTFGATTQDLNNGNGSRPYDCVINCNNRPLSDVYEYLKYVTRYGSSTSLNGTSGDQYQAVGDIRLAYESQTGNYTEGLTVIGNLSDATAVIVADHDSGPSGALVLRQVSGTFLDGETLTDTSTGSATVNGSAETITQVKASPFGIFAGGKLFAARGIWLSNVPAADINNFELLDSENESQVPPNVIALVVTGVVQNTQCYIVDATPTTYLNTSATISVSGDTYQASTTLTYTTDINVTVRARERGYLPFETTGTITDTGLTVTAVWQVDPNWKLVVTGVTITFNENSPSADTIVRTTGDFASDGWVGIMSQVTVVGSASNDGTYEIGSVVTDTLTLAVTEDLVAEGPVAGVTLTFTRRSL